MPITGTFNGQNVVALPTTPVAQNISWSATSAASVSTNPFTLTQQIVDWQSALLEAEITLPAMTDAQARQWIAFMLQCRLSNVFSFGDPLAVLPLGTKTGTPVVNGANQTGFALATSGWTANSTNNLLPGDWIQVGVRLYRVLDPVNADGSGHATLSIFPQLRESPNSGTSIITSHTQGMFRMASNQMKWSMTEAKLYGITFSIREAI